MCFIPRSMLAIKFHSGPKHVEVPAASLPLTSSESHCKSHCHAHPQRPTTRKQKQTLTVNDTVIPFLPNQALVFTDTSGFLGTKNDYLFQKTESQEEFRRGSLGRKWRANMRTERFGQ